MHFTWDITLGNVILGVPLMGLLIVGMRVHSMLLHFRIEHEYLMQDWAERNGKALDAMPTRKKGIW